MGGDAFTVGVDGIAQTNCAGMTSYWWDQLGLPDLGNVGVQFTYADIAPYFDTTVTMNQLNPGDIIWMSYPGATLNHVGMYIGDNLVAHMANEIDDIIIDNLQTFWSQGNVVGVIRVPGY